jgi:steroid 5-alpha reductase family enzyme
MELLITLAVSLGINLVMFVPAYMFQTDKLTDISYAVTFLVVTLFGLLSNDISLIKVLYFVAVLLWAIRLGSYLLIRIHKIGKDKRFDGMRENFLFFLRFWVLQGLTVWVVMIPGVLFLNSSALDVGVVSIVGLGMFLLGLIFEAVADIQKYTFINDPKNKGRWIDTGLWSISRHPNYLGEITVWLGLYITVFPFLSGLGILIGSVGPLFIAGMIIFVSGIPILEKGADKIWGEDSEYQQYKKNTGVLFPKFFKKGG